MASETPLAVSIGVEDHLVDAVGVVLEPGEQRRTEVEADARVVIEDADDLVLRIDDAGGAVGRIAFSRDALIPIMVGRGEPCLSTASSQGFSRGGW